MNFNKFQQISKYFQRKSRAFTLVEVLVAMTIFVGTLILMSQIYVSAMRSERVAYSLLQNDESVRYALDYMSKTIRMGKDFTSPDSSTLSFNYYYVDPTGFQTGWQPISYSFQNDSITRSFLGKTINLLPPAVKISNGQWNLISRTDTSQAKVAIDFTVQSQRTHKFHIQTAITPRLLFNVGNVNP